MPATRDKANIIVRAHGSDGYVSVEVRAFGPDNTQKACADGQMEFDTKKFKFVNVALKDRRKKFDAAAVDPGAILNRYTLADRKFGTNKPAQRPTDPTPV